MTNIDTTIEKYVKIAKYGINPFRCLYFNPSKYTLVQFAKWCQQYLQNRIYVALIKTAPITGFEVVPSELLLRQAKRDGYSDRRVMAGGLSFYLIKQSEMSKGLLKRYLDFKEEMSKNLRNEVSSNNKGGAGDV
ncbi:hypothetical protein [Desulforamulus aeronauticus]|uniref:Uncharacterized protein n=1 Tax=Desulforamulus aeronauticus DSM 10349 TaxID=1121421 RepID=A0A1M6WFJ4_9FIRM|nr:hypothetical protein [Desulforamulus aeronauticus]SHK92295.1 hypothetical protein SAMN02745123_03597 [Desulforamulus aeronauticus DSM 10349]